ncbi:MAG: hypothetical protein AB8E82_18245 [Aureispira sp.]
MLSILALVGLLISKKNGPVTEKAIRAFGLTVKVKSIIDLKYKIKK